MVSGLGSWLVYRQLVIRTLGPGCPRVRYRVMFGQEVVPQVDGYLGGRMSRLAALNKAERIGLWCLEG